MFMKNFLIYTVKNRKFFGKKNSHLFPEFPRFSWFFPYFPKYLFFPLVHTQWFFSPLFGKFFSRSGIFSPTAGKIKIKIWYLFSHIFPKFLIFSRDKFSRFVHRQWNIFPDGKFLPNFSQQKPYREINFFSNLPYFLMIIFPALSTGSEIFSQEGNFNPNFPNTKPVWEINIFPLFPDSSEDKITLFVHRVGNILLDRYCIFIPPLLHINL